MAIWLRIDGQGLSHLIRNQIQNDNLPNRRITTLSNLTILACCKGEGLWETWEALRAFSLLYVEPINSITNTAESRTQKESHTKPKIGRQSDCVFERKM